MKFRYTLFIVTCFYVSLFIKFNTPIILDTKKGALQSIQFQFPNGGFGTQSSQASVPESIEGKIQDEISKIQNKIQYPSYALEERLEAKCEFSIQVNENRKASQLKTVRQCSDKSFEQEFKRVIFSWEFSLPVGTVLNIPVNFRLEK